jgi:hypothetical protein
VHCLLTPVLVAFGGLGLAGAVVSERAEPIFVGVSLLIGLASLGPAFLRVHRDPMPIALFVVGLAALTLARVLDTPPLVERAIVPICAGLLIAAHTRNHRACVRCRVCEGAARESTEYSDHGIDGAQPRRCREATKW